MTAPKDHRSVTVAKTDRTVAGTSTHFEWRITVPDVAPAHPQPTGLLGWLWRLLDR